MKYEVGGHFYDDTGRSGLITSAGACTVTIQWPYRCSKYDEALLTTICIARGWRYEPPAQKVPVEPFGTPPSSPSLADEIRTVTDGVLKMLLEKNHRYGDSVFNPAHVFSQSAPEEALRVRIDDKIARIRNAAPGETEDSELDLLGYLVLLRVLRGRKNG